MPRIERKYLAHYLNSNFGGVGTADYQRLGKDLEGYNEELNPDVEVMKNILGEQNVTHKGYEVQSEVDPYYADFGDPLYDALSEIVNERKTGDACLTQKVDVLVDGTGRVDWAYREDVYVIPKSIGGDTSGVQIPFSIYNAGNRVAGTWDASTKTFTPTNGVSSGSSSNSGSGSGSGSESGSGSGSGTP